MPTDTENRSFRLRELREVPTENHGEKIIEGHAAVFDCPANIGNQFYEVIERGAFNETSLRDVSLFVNHDATQIPMARTLSRTMLVAVDGIGLYIRARLDVENNPAARALYSAVKRGDLQAMSFCFTVAEDDWQNLNSDMPTRRIKKFEQIFEVSAVTTPAYSETDLQARAAQAQTTLARAQKRAQKNTVKGRSDMYQFDDSYDERTAAVNAACGYPCDTSPRFIQGNGFIPSNESQTRNRAIELEQRDVAGKKLMQTNHTVQSPFNAFGELRALTVTLAAGSPATIAVPSYSSGSINADFSVVSTLIDSVAHLSLPGGESFRQPYITGIAAGGYTAEGANAAQAETHFDFADINRTKITAYAELTEEFLKLPAANYADEVFKNIRESMRELLTKEILVGEGITENDQFRVVGIFSDKATAIDPSTDLELSAITDTTLDEILYSYGGSECVEAAPVLILNKLDLLAFAKVRTSTQQKFYDIKLNGNGNSGTISGVPFILNSACKSLATVTGTFAATAGDYCMAYGSLSNYLLCEFTPLEVKRSDDYKFRGGFSCFRGSCFVGGNVVRRNGFLRIRKSA